MKLLKIKAAGIPLFKNSVEIDFITEQKVTEYSREKLYNIFLNHYQNNVVSIVGINASGKTSLLKVLSFSINLLNNKPINSIPCNEILDGITEEQPAIFENYFYSQNQIYCLRTTVKRHTDRYYIAEESLISKKITKSMRKASVFDFSAKTSVVERNVNEQYLLDDVSIIVAFNKKIKESIQITDMLQDTNTNILRISKDFPTELLAFFDPSVDYLKINSERKKTEIHLKFKNKDEIILNRFEELNKFLSSGTIKGINTFVYAMESFKTGGYILIDEIENHFNQEIVSTLIRFFQDPEINPNGAVLVFSTHYSELLDEFERNDNIYIVRNTDGISTQKLSDILKRNDIKKSEAFQSGYLGGTTIDYNPYLALRKMLINQAKGE